MTKLGPPICSVIEQCQQNIKDLKKRWARIMQDHTETSWAHRSFACIGLFGGCSVTLFYKQQKTKDFERNNIDLVVTLLIVK
jgi:hypothetical protein